MSDMQYAAFGHGRQCLSLSPYVQYLPQKFAVHALNISPDAAHGLGKHASDVPGGAPGGATFFFAVLYPEEILYMTGFSLVKLSVLLFYRRIFPGQRFKQALWIVTFLVIGWGVTMTFASALQCIPIRKAWNPDVPGKCINLHAYYFGQAIPNSITDGIILLLPLPSLWKLQVPRSQKVALIAIFFLGGL